jgi:hypothetical protein
LSASRPGHFTHPPVPIGLKAGWLDAMAKRNLLPFAGSEPRFFGAVRGLASVAMSRHLCDVNTYSKRQSSDKTCLIIFRHVWVVKTSVLSADKAGNFITSYVHVNEHVYEMF